MKKTIALLIVGSLLTAQTAYAEEGITVAFEEKVYTSEIYESKGLEGVFVDPELTGFVDVFQEVAIELTESEKSKLVLLVEFISQTNGKLQALLVTGQYEEAASMLEKYNFDVDRVQELLETSIMDETAVEELAVFEEIAETFAEKTSMRGVNLTKLLESGDLPASALAGINKALANQERAQDKRQMAQERKEQRKALKEEKKAAKQDKKEHVTEGADVEEVIAASLEKKQGKPEKAQKAQDKAGKQAEKGKERAAKAQENGNERAGKAQQKASQQGKENNGKNK